MIIRPETPGDIKAIRALTIAAFDPTPYSSGTEAPIIEALRKDGDLTLSLVGLQDGEIAAHITFSPVTIGGEQGGWFGLGPVSVAPALQRRGYGSQIIHEGLSRIQSLGAKGCALIGNPDYYARFGFMSDGHLTYGAAPPEIVQWLSFEGRKPKGELKYSPGFETF